MSPTSTTQPADVQASAPLSEQQLAEMQERVLIATPGPWELYPEYGPNFYANVRGGMLLPVGSIDFGDGESADADRALVEHAAEDIAALLAEVDRLRGALSEATDYIAAQDSEIGGWSARVAELEARLATARRDALNEAATVVFETTAPEGETADVITWWNTATNVAQFNLRSLAERTGGVR